MRERKCCTCKYEKESGKKKICRECISASLVGTAKKPNWKEKNGKI